MRMITVFLVFLSVGPLASAAPPSEVPGDAFFGADRQTLTWSAVAGATSYNVYGGSDPAFHDQVCRVSRTTETNAVLEEVPVDPGQMIYFLITASNADGEGTLGDEATGERPNRFPCVDADADLVPDNLDNCPTIANPGQADQDANGVGDRCDPNTYDFEADLPGQRPAGMTRLAGATPTFTIKDVSGDRCASFDADGTGAHERFERLLAKMPFQNTTIYLDYDAAPEVLSIEMWSDGAYGWNAGNGAILQIGAAGGLTFYDRHGQQVPSIPGPAAPADGRLRLRIEKGPGTVSTLHVDTWDGSAWGPDYATFPITDDHRYRGLGTVIGDYFGGRRALKRATIVHEAPTEPLLLRKDPSWSTDWKLFQRNQQGSATIPLRYYTTLETPGRVESRVVYSKNGGVVTGHDWSDHVAVVPAAAGVAGSLDVTAVPSGGNYDVEVRLVRDSDQAILGQGVIREIAVGDVFLAGGQSNMSGYSGNMVGAETPIDEVHLFHNDYTWKRAAEPMDDGTDQVDLVSSESPLHTLMLRFAKEAYQATGVPIGIVPGPLGGTNLYSQWQRDAADHDNRGTLYGSLLHRGLAQNYGAPIRGFLWYQGESDVGRGTADYKANLKQLIAQYREDLANPSLYFEIVQLATNQGSNLTNWIAIQEAQRQVVEEDPQTALAVTVDQPRSDTIHLNVEGYKVVGVRLAREALEHLYGQPIDASIRLVEARAGNNGATVELVYEGNVTGGTPGLYRLRDSSGTRTITGVSTSGNIVTLSVQGRLKSGALVSYGYSWDPAAPWLKDANGQAVACYQDFPVAP